jgi:putative endonuclease
MYFVYILKSLKDQRLYVGYSKEVRRRLEEHNSGKVDATRYRLPLILIYFEAYQNQQDATSREKYYKSGWGRAHLKKILSSYLKDEHNRFLDN